MAQSLLERSVSIYEPKVHPDVLPDAMVSALTNLAAVFVVQSDYARAAPVYEKVLAIRERFQGKDHPDLSTLLIGMGTLNYEQGKDQEAIFWHERALAISEKHRGPWHTEVAAGLNNSANAYARLVCTRAVPGGISTCELVYQC